MKEDSACLDLPNEDRVGVAANHRDMCRFSDANSREYFPIGMAVKQLVNSAVGASASCT